MSTISNSLTPVYNTKGQAAGQIWPDLCLIKRARASRHMLRNPHGWAWDTRILEEAKEKGVFIVYIIDEDTNTVYEAPLDEFWAHGQRIDRGHGEQICLPLKYWQITESYS